MGYRSDVGIALGFETKEECDKFIVAYKIKEPEFWKDMIAGVWERPDGRVLTVQYADVKWYRGLDDVDGVYHMLHWAIDNHYANYQVIRIGEDLDDVEVDDVSLHDIDLFLSDFVDMQRQVFTSEGEPLD